MKQKLFFLMLTLIMLSVASVQAQVTIGTDESPHSAAILDLQSTTLGLKLPVIELGDVSVFQLSGTEDEADGIMIYNSSDATIGGAGKGIYVWEGKWVFAARNAPVDVPITRINITSKDYAKEVNAGDELELTATIEPDNATNKVLRWTQVYSSSLAAGKVTIDNNGTITAVKAGNVTVRATATDDSNAYRDIALTVLPTTPTDKITIVPINNASPIAIGTPLQLEARVEPLTANPNVMWLSSDPDLATVTITAGLVSPLTVGSATITATAIDGSEETASFTFEIIDAPALATTPYEIGGVTYPTYVFNGYRWTVQNIHHGVANFYENPDDEGVENYYYSLPQAVVACGDEWHVPSYQEANALIGYLNGTPTPAAKNVWFGTQNLVGLNGSNGAWSGFGNRNVYAVTTDLYYMDIRTTSAMMNSFGSNKDLYSLPVRCVQNY